MDTEHARARGIEDGLGVGGLVCVISNTQQELFAPLQLLVAW